MKRKMLAVMLTVLMAVSMFAVGCAKKAPETPEAPKTEDEQKTDTEEQAEETPNGETVKVAMVTDTGGVNDQSFNQSAWEGLQRAEKDLKIKASYKESSQESDYGPNLESLFDAENNLIWGIGYMMADAVQEAAEKNPEQQYAIVDFAYDETPENVTGVVFKAEQPSFLVGYIAARMTKTNKIGFVGGKKGFIIDAFEYGYRAGAKYANKDVEILIQYADSFSDSAKGKAITNQMYQEGADIVFHAAGGVGFGVIESAKENGKYVIGVDRDQNDLAPDNVITSAVKRVDNALYNLAKDVKEGTHQGGKTVVYGLAEGGVDIAATSDKHVPESILKDVENLKKQIIEETIVVPFNEETFTEYMSTLK